MCGRYQLFAQREIAELSRIAWEVSSRHPGMLSSIGEVYPQNRVPVLTAEQGGVAADLFLWGFPGWSKKSVIINARAETAGEKPMFRDCLKHRRCVIPASGFYEWSHDGEKRRYLFTGFKPVLYLAGLYSVFIDQLGEPESRFAILTTEANASMREIHSRMPCILTREEVEPWILDDGSTAELLLKIPPELNRERYESGS